MTQDVDTLSAASAGSAMRYASVCDGIGAAHVAWQPLGWQCQWTSEIEPFPAAVVEHHYGFRNLGDMTAITEEMLDAPVELLVGGTPCQSFSVAGLRKGLDDPRGNLALRFVQLAAVMQPKWIVWENVPGVLSSGKGRDFGTFLWALGELGYGFAYRVLDAQWFGVAQRRRRVFVVGYLGDWRRAAAVLFERESVFGNPPTRGKAWEGVARSTASSLTSSGRGVERCGESRGQDDVVLAEAKVVDFQNYSFTGDQCGTLQSAAMAKQNTGFGVVAFNGQMPTPQVDVELTQTLQRKNPQAVAFTKSKRAQSNTDDETWVPGEVSPRMSCFDQGDTRATTVVAIQERAICENPDAGPDGAGVRTDGVSYTLEARTVPQAVAFANRTRDGVKVPEVMKDGVVPALTNPGAGGRADAVNVLAIQDCGGREKRQNGKGWNGDGTAYTVDAAATQGVACPMAVRRLTPRECERLQGFSDDFTAITYRGKPAADGPRYRALGNSMAVPVMRWIGERIQAVDRL